jgi:hypothetical protein
MVFWTLILRCFGGGDGVLAATTPRPFAVFNANVDLDIEDGEFEVMATVTLGAGNNGIDLSAETVIVQVTGGTAAFSVTIPPGSFKKDRSGQFAFQGTVDKVRLQASLRALRDGAFGFEIEGDRVNLKGVANPVTVSLTIGDDSGSRSVRAKIE